MNQFVEAICETQVPTLTANGGRTWDSSKNSLVDLFFSIGSSRGKDLSSEFNRALAEDLSLALRLLFWARDVRGGCGERQTVRTILLDLEKNHSEILGNILHHLPTFGRWDDLLIFQTKEIKEKAYAIIQRALLNGDGLACKWMPRKGEIAVELRQFCKLSPKKYRKLLVNGTQVVEQKMCSGEWTSINYSGVPSLASSRYQKAFKRHDEEGYEKWKEKLKNGEASVNAGAVYPYDIIKSYRAGGDNTVIGTQWNNLPNYCGEELVLPMVDVSGSMNIPVAGNKNLSCLDVSVSLGLYLADKNRGPFKDIFLTFSEQSKIQRLQGDLISKIAQLESSEWGMNTNLESAFDTILFYAKEGKVKASDMPAYLLILSDMEFDEGAEFDESSMEMIQRKYQEAGYVVPKIVFWNLNARKGNVPVKYNKEGVALVSGFSPAIMTSILSAKNFTPMDIMLETLNQPRYCVV